MAFKQLQQVYRLILIDDLTIDTHFHLRHDDECYYLMEYKKEDGFENAEKQLLYNFKKKPELRNTLQWPHKINAIRKLSGYYQASVVPTFGLPNTTLIPIPPSCHKNDPNYDDRLTRLLRASFPQGSDIRELLVNKANIRSSHENANNRPSPQELMDNMMFDESLAHSIGERIVLFDDVLTSGAHFRACKTMIADRFPGIKVSGVFISRVFFPRFDPFDFDFFFPEDQETDF